MRIFFRLVLIIISFVTCFSVYAADVLLPDLNNPEKRVFTHNQARQYGIAVEGRLRQQGKLLEQPEITQYIRHLGDKLALYAPSINQYHFFVIDSPSINAFALPGGFIGIHSGLINATDNEDQLASVMAHEIGHVSQRHIARSIARAQDLKWLNAIGMLAAIAVGTISENHDVMGSVAIGSQAYLKERDLEYSRSHEQQADDVSRQILIKAGYDANEIGRFLGKLKISTQIPEFLLTHPLPENRVMRQDALNSQPHREARIPLDYEIAKVATALYSNNKHGVNFELSALAQNYQKALIALRNYNYKQLSAYLPKLDPNQHPAFAAMHAQNALVQSDYNLAYEILYKAWKKWPNDERLALPFARVLFIKGQYNESEKILNTMISDNPTAVQYYDLLGEVFNRQNKIAEQFMLSAKYYSLIGDYKLAASQMERGLNDNRVSLTDKQKMKALKHQYMSNIDK